MKRFLTLVSTLALVGSISPTLTSSAWAAEPIDTASTALKHDTFGQSTTSSYQVASSVSRRYWVNYSDLPRTTSGQVNTAAIADWSVDLPNDDREYLYNPSTRQLTSLDDLASKDEIPALLVEMVTNTNSSSVRVCREGLRLLGLTALRCRQSELADLPIRNPSSQSTVTSSRTATPEVITSSSSPDVIATPTVTTTEVAANNSSTPIDVALRNVNSAVPNVGDRIGNLAVTQVWNSNHMGIDLALPQQNGRWPDSTGIPIYAIGAPGTKVEVRCWYEPIAGQNASTYAEGMDYAFDFAHLDTCVAGERGTVTVNAGDRIGTIGNSGSATTGPHLHMQQRYNGTANPVTGDHVEAWAGYIEMAVSGVGTNSIATNR